MNQIDYDKRTIWSGVSDSPEGNRYMRSCIIHNCHMTSALRYSGPSGDDPVVICPVCNKPMIITSTNRSREWGVAFQCPYCYEWLRFKAVSGNKPPNLSDEEVRRWHVVEIIRLDKEEIEKVSRNKTETEIFEWGA
jgi:predicted RNA-binding Zn-ribbon protein involved in translation (DUF1610 family)